MLIIRKARTVSFSAPATSVTCTRHVLARKRSSQSHALYIKPHLHKMESVCKVLSGVSFLIIKLCVQLRALLYKEEVFKRIDQL